MRVVVCDSCAASRMLADGLPCKTFLPEIQNLGMERESVQMASYRNGCCIAGKHGNSGTYVAYHSIYIIRGNKP